MTYDRFNNLLPSEVISSDQIDDITCFSGRRISISSIRTRGRNWSSKRRLVSGATLRARTSSVCCPLSAKLATR
ncbi:MAG: hypothetical protein Q8O11_08830 [Syntrophales bacterium]|nr:hypothetical protein [Syntrophales bacterium]